MSNRKKAYNVIFKEVPMEEGVNRADINYMFDHLKGEYAIPLEIDGYNSAAIGLINLETADKMDYDYTELISYVTEILNDMDKETFDGEYKMKINRKNYSIKIYR